VNQILKYIGPLGPTGMRGYCYTEPSPEDDGSVGWRLARLKVDLAEFMNAKRAMATPITGHDLTALINALDDVLAIATERGDLRLLAVLSRLLPEAQR